MIDIEVIDNFLDQSYIDLVEDWILRHGKWSYRPNISGDPWGKIQNPWFHGLGIKIHDPSCPERDTFDSTGYTIMIPAILKIQETFGLPLNLMESCIRARFDMTLKAPENSIHDPHVDFNDPHYACILYINDSDGDTVIYNQRNLKDTFTIKKTISPKKNRLVFFNGAYCHTGHSPSKHQNRILLNSNYYIPL
ncbi:DNA endonuclease V [Prochlorococcus phage P-SSM7]|uniref:DNA endonuclease V n=1 Tax=Prochlorococcus phage P-SSM7 TaxID=445688 RepID=E3SNF2_9CAUD|nr:DNA endonuclease V [Prochlorococcus phage P-SSM7]ADO99069.1 DNA endonuclease V [Prochlorococcus phage P-SSM7]